MSKVLITNPDGSTFYSCECIRQIWPTLQELLVSRGVVKKNLDVTQGSYNTSVRASARTHFGGGVLDIRQTSSIMDALLEEAGFASYVRTPEDGFSWHTHVILRSCPHLDPSAARQVTSWYNRRNALVSNRPDRDQSRPAVMRNLAQGMSWIRQQLGRAVSGVAAPVIKRPETIRTMGKGRPISLRVTLANRGKPNGNVKIIQQILQVQKAAGVPYYPGKLDGIYGPQTKAAVAKYQRALGFTGSDADGILGWQTFSRLVAWAGWKAVR